MQNVDDSKDEETNESVVGMSAILDTVLVEPIKTVDETKDAAMQNVDDSNTVVITTLQKSAHIGPAFLKQELANLDQQDIDKIADIIFDQCVSEVALDVYAVAAVQIDAKIIAIKAAAPISTPKVAEKRGKPPPLQLQSLSADKGILNSPAVLAKPGATDQRKESPISDVIDDCRKTLSAQLKLILKDEIHNSAPGVLQSLLPVAKGYDGRIGETMSLVANAYQEAIDEIFIPHTQYKDANSPYIIGGRLKPRPITSAALLNSVEKLISKWFQYPEKHGENLGPFLMSEMIIEERGYHKLEISQEELLLEAVDIMWEEFLQEAASDIILALS